MVSRQLLELFMCAETWFLGNYWNFSCALRIQLFRSYCIHVHRNCIALPHCIVLPWNLRRGLVWKAIAQIFEINVGDVREKLHINVLCHMKALYREVFAKVTTGSIWLAEHLNIHNHKTKNATGTKLGLNVQNANTQGTMDRIVYVVPMATGNRPIS